MKYSGHLYRAPTRRDLDRLSLPGRSGGRRSGSRPVEAVRHPRTPERTATHAGRRSAAHSEEGVSQGISTSALRSRSVRSAGDRPDVRSGTGRELLPGRLETGLTPRSGARPRPGRQRCRDQWSDPSSGPFRLGPTIPASAPPRRLRASAKRSTLCVARPSGTTRRGRAMTRSHGTRRTTSELGRNRDLERRVGCEPFGLV